MGRFLRKSIGDGHKIESLVHPVFSMTDLFQPKSETERSEMTFEITTRAYLLIVSPSINLFIKLLEEMSLDHLSSLNQTFDT